MISFVVLVAIFFVVVVVLFSSSSSSIEISNPTSVSPLVTALSKFHIILYYVYHMIHLQESINISHPHGLYISYLLAVSFCRQLASIVRRICIKSSFIAPFLVLAVTNGLVLYYCNACAYVHVVYCGIIVIQISGGYAEANMCHDVSVLFACFVAMQKTCVFF